MIAELGALVEAELGPRWAITRIPFGWSGGYIDARRAGGPDRVVVAFGDHPRAATTLPFVFNRRGPHFGLRLPDGEETANCRGYRFHGDLDWLPTLEGCVALDVLAATVAEVEAVGTRLRVRALRLGEGQLRPFVEGFLALRAAVLDAHLKDGRVVEVGRGERPRRKKKPIEDRVVELRVHHAREATAHWDGQVERRGDGVEGRLTLPALDCGGRFFLDGDRRLRLEAELPRAFPGPVALTPQRGLLGWLQSFGELEVGDARLDPAWIVDAPPAAAPLLRALAPQLMGLAAEVEVAVRVEERLLEVEASDRALVAALELWRAAAAVALS